MRTDFCYECGEGFKKEELQEAENENNETVFMCQECYDETQEMCDECGAIRNRNTFKYWAHREWMCSACFYKH